MESDEEKQGASPSDEAKREVSYALETKVWNLIDGTTSGCTR